ncbi:pyridoxamine 5'-phosphate oxidase family protein [Tuberibacillus sp. Marseille-P3662]|uniref:pyridoxamine 5'-phosphate oxidase family protein n=1 Tax=Tuberibacillus sp. Marseille-P3662 TaxID=1965358 RepID=UPI000A1C8193|nr:pyridoxamine 5'-phosphate oxidase family protein [Tuberibacillus sp. Marseille-P3662]
MNGLSEGLCTFLNGHDLDQKIHEAMLLVTVDENGRPHMAMISVGEVVAVSPNHLRLALWPSSTTTANLLRNGQSNLTIIYHGAAYYLKLHVDTLPELKETKYPRQRFEATVTSVKEDTSNYAEITSGIQINLQDPEEVVNRWRATINDLLK